MFTANIVFLKSMMGEQYQRFPFVAVFLVVGLGISVLISTIGGLSGFNIFCCAAVCWMIGLFWVPLLSSKLPPGVWKFRHMISELEL